MKKKKKTDLPSTLPSSKSLTKRGVPFAVLHPVHDSTHFDLETIETTVVYSRPTGKKPEENVPTFY